MSKYFCGSSTLYITEGSMCIIATFLEDVLNWLVSDEIIYT